MDDQVSQTSPVGQARLECQNHQGRTPGITRKKSLVGALVMAAFMFVSRILGLFRDLNTAAVMGMSGSVAMDAFVCAFRVPDMARRVFEEGIFGLAYIPVFSKYWASDRRRAWRLASAFLWRGMLAGIAATMAGEIAVGLAWVFLAPPEGTLWHAVLVFSTLMFPFMTFVFPAAQCAATLQGMGKFTLSGMMPPLFNAVWLIALLLVSPAGIYLPFKVSLGCKWSLGHGLDPVAQGEILSAAIVIASILQAVIQYTWLRGLGADLMLPVKTSGDAEATGNTIEKGVPDGTGMGQVAWRILGRTVPAALAVSFVQVNTLLAVILALLFSSQTIPVLSAVPWINESFAGTTQLGSASALYFGERLYGFPLAFIGTTLGTAFYPLLARRISEKNKAGFAEDLSLGLRLLAILAIPAGVGLAMVSGTLVRLLFMHGEFSAEDTARTAKILILFGSGIPAFCLASLMARAAVAQGAVRFAIRVGLKSTLFFLVMGLFAVRAHGESGLAAAITAGAWLQAFSLFSSLAPEFSREQMSALARSLRQAVLASGAMALGILGVRRLAESLCCLPGPDAAVREASLSAFASLALDIGTGILVFGTVLLALGGGEIRQLRQALRERRALRKKEKTGIIASTRVETNKRDSL